MKCIVAPEAAPPRIQTVVLQPTPFCDIDCSYCYLPQRNVKSVMRQATVATLFEKIFASGWADPHLAVIWHAGEPLVLPAEYYEEAFTAIAALQPAEQHVRHAMQTNGMLISPEWCALFRRWGVGVGVSIDGPRHLHNRHRRTRSGQGTFDRTIAGIRLLRQEQLPFHVISVLSEESLDAPEEMLDFFLGEGIEDVCFNVEESEGQHVSGLFARRDARAKFHDFLERFWRLARSSGRIRFIREIDTMLPRVFRPQDAALQNVQVAPFGMLNVDCNGQVSSYSPELLGYKNDTYNDFVIGDILVHSLEEMAASAAMAAMTRDIAAGVEICRHSCEYFSVCGGGAPVNKLSENGSFRSGKTWFCRLTQIVPVDLILDAFDRLEVGIDARTSAEGEAV